ncbi:MAG: hypothetical protein KGI79_02085 [Patescibacteria group bacterium]|nr:hypothetical protein [Patescibacteria group bacterium]MDE2116640.1 hypothetical protein [Patescibacteria group bacterium]
MNIESVLAQVFSGNPENIKLIPPDDEVEPGEVIVGTIQNPRTKALYSLTMRATDEGNKTLEHIRAALRPDMPSAERRELVRRAAAVHGLARTIADVFQEMLKDEFPEVRDEGITFGIRTDWRVVIYKSPAPSVSSSSFVVNLTPEIIERLQAIRDSRK